MAEAFQFDARPLDAALQRLLDRLQSKSGLLAVLGNLMVRSIHQTMREEGNPPGSWRRLYAGTIQQQYEAKGKGKKPRKSWTKGGRNTAGFLGFVKNKRLLYGSGTLYQRIAYSVDESSSSVTVGSALKYARIHQFGGVIVPKNKKFLRFPIGGGQFMFAKRVVLPARPFVVLRPEDPGQLHQGVVDYLQSVFQGAAGGSQAGGN